MKSLLSFMGSTLLAGSIALPIAKFSGEKNILNDTTFFEQTSNNDQAEFYEDTTYQYDNVTKDIYTLFHMSTTNVTINVSAAANTKKTAITRFVQPMPSNPSNYIFQYEHTYVPVVDELSHIEITWGNDVFRLPSPYSWKKLYYNGGISNTKAESFDQGIEYSAVKLLEATYRSGLATTYVGFFTGTTYYYENGQWYYQLINRTVIESSWTFSNTYVKHNIGSFFVMSDEPGKANTID